MLQTMPPIAWKLKTLHRVIRSTISAEASATIDALDLSYFISHVLSEILDPIPKLTKIRNYYRPLP